MKPIESYPDKKHCESCGALIINGEADPQTEHSGAEVIRRLAFIADQSPSLAILMIYHIVGRKEQEIATKLHINQSNVSRRIARAHKVIAQLAP